jgi:hypothetical protein
MSVRLGDRACSNTGFEGVVVAKCTPIGNPETAIVEIRSVSGEERWFGAELCRHVPAPLGWIDEGTGV